MDSHHLLGNFRRRVIIDVSDSSDASSTSSSSPSLSDKDRAAPLHSAAAGGAARPRRKYSLGSLLSDSSGELEEMFSQATISKKLLSKLPPEITFKRYHFSSSDEDSSDDDPKRKPSKSKQSSRENNNPNKSTTKDEEDPDSAWCQKPGTQDFVLSRTKRPDVDWPDLCLPSPLYHQLYSFQRQGVQWMASLHAQGIGGILGDDMGMGKTWVTLSYLGGLMRARTIRNALIIAPLSVVHSWRNEGRKILGQCVLNVQVTVLNSEMSKERRNKFFHSLTKKTKPGKQPTCNLVITTYGLVRSATADFAPDNQTVWHYVALDEGHTIKNSSAEVSKACRAICSPDTRRLLLTGTPILNNLKELWSLFDFATNGQVLGSSKSFTQYYAHHIEAARDRLATVGIIELGQRKNKELQELIRPYFLQRLKIDFLKDKLPPKTDLVVWTHLSDEQRRRYTEFVESKDSIVRSILSGTVQSPLEAVTWLKKLCGHPLLIDATGQEINDFLRSTNPQQVLRQSAKLQVLVDLVQHLKRNKHRMLIFSQSTKMLDTINFVLRDRLVLARIDGTTKDRQDLVDAFNAENSCYDAMLLSTKAAGCGLTLNGADVSIIYDPSWTPAEDAQAVDRCYRIGQKRAVTVYRLIAAGTVEEKTYEKQIHKDGISRAVLSNDEAVERYFERHELRSLFRLGERGVCHVLERFKNVVDINQYEHVFDLEGVIGITPHDGFYLKNGTSSSAPFVGPVKSSAAKILGKSQRVMARAAQRSEEGATPSPDHSSRKIPATNTLSSNLVLRDSSNEGKNADSVDSTQKTKGGTKDDTSPDTGPCETPSTSEKYTITHMLETVSGLLERGHHRKALEMLLDLVEAGTLVGQDKLEVHKRVAIVARTLGLH